MARQRKVIRTKTLYKRRRFPRGTGSKVLFVLLVLVLIGVGFIVMSEWSKRFGPNAPKPPVSSTLPVESTPPPTSSEAPVSSTEETPEAVSQKSAFLSSEELLLKSTQLESVMADFKTAGYTAVTVELKPISGMLPYKSTVEDAVKYATIEANAVSVADIINAANKAGLVPIAQISAFKDQSIAHVSRENSFAYSNQLTVNWLDNSVANGGKAWLNPYMPKARKYICDIASELTKAGFKTISVQNVMFPDKNVKNMNTIVTEPSRDEILMQSVKEIKTAVGDARVSVVIDMAKDAALEGNNPLKTKVEAIYATGTSPALYISLADIQKNKKVICTNAAIVGANGYDPAILPAQVIQGLIEQLSVGTGGANKKPSVILSSVDFEVVKGTLAKLNIEDITIIQ